LLFTLRILAICNNAAIFIFFDEKIESTYFSKKRYMKYNLAQMKSLDFYLSSLSDKEYKEVAPQIKPLESNIMPLISWDIFNQNYFDTLKTAKTEGDIKMIKSFAKKAKWQNKIDDLFTSKNFEALIITDLEQKILWVNDGFTDMTGYSKKFAINKTPNFLQGINTLPETKKRISNRLKDLKPFTEIITNYKKDNTSYKCEVKIIPMYSENVTHFLAIERQIV